MVEVVEDYRFEGPTAGRPCSTSSRAASQLIVDHYMFDPEWDEGCLSCAGRVDQYGNIAHLHERDTTIAVVSRAPFAKIERFKRKMGWDFPWWSSFGSRFNFDYGVSFDERSRTGLQLPLGGGVGGARNARAGAASCTARACSCASGSASSTRTRPTAAARSRWAAPTTTST